MTNKNLDEDDIERENKRKENTKSMNAEETKVAKIKLIMFYESVTYVTTSVNDANKDKYQAFSQTLQQS